jgi:hypothetical protein
MKRHIFKYSINQKQTIGSFLKIFYLFNIPVSAAKKLVNKAVFVLLYCIQIKKIGFFFTGDKINLCNMSKMLEKYYNGFVKDRKT